MNSEQWQSIIRTLLALLIGPAGYLVTKGILTPEQADQLMPAIVSVLVVVVGAAVGKWGIASHSAPAVTAAVNSDSVPGVKAVSTNSPGTPVTIDNLGIVKPVVDPKTS